MMYSRLFLPGTFACCGQKCPLFNPLSTPALPSVAGCCVRDHVIDSTARDTHPKMIQDLLRMRNEVCVPAAPVSKSKQQVGEYYFLALFECPFSFPSFQFILLLKYDLLRSFKNLLRSVRFFRPILNHSFFSGILFNGSFSFFFKQS